MKNIFLLLILSLFLGACSKDSDHHDQVLLIGDSISRGYSTFVREKLDGQYTVSTLVDPYEPQNVMNARNTWHTLYWIDYMLEQCHNCKVIVWNNGIWNASRQDVSAAESDPRHYWTSTAQYESDLAQIAAKMKATGARVIFMTSTRLPPSTAYFFDVGRENELNTSAKNILPALGVEVYDLGALSQTFSLDMHDGTGSPHWGDGANNLLADFVVNAILNR